MKKENARKQTLEQLHERRKQVVLLLKSDTGIMQSVATTELSYNPQLNHEERFNADLKQKMDKRVSVRNKTKIRQAANEHMMMLDHTHERVSGCFQDRRVRYAA